MKQKLISQQQIKSPLDTTIYAPALVKSPVQNQNNLQVNDMISEFVDNMRMEHSQDLQERERQRASTSDVVPRLEEAKDHNDKAILETEKFKATISNPGMGEMLSFPSIGSGVSDDDFFHLTCHIDPNLIHKIEKGEFVELEKLLPKDKIGKTGEENRLEWVQRDGKTFLVPAQRDVKIASFRRWEQAFRVYATIYCGANPYRSKEIWQYITVINTAASSYTWHNVYNYDIMFRHLMAFNPNRSWAVTYNQMWNLSMRDPLPRNFGQKQGNANSFQYQYHSGNGSNQKQQNSGNRKKSDYCWNFNKGVPCKFGSKCKFIERCKYCDSSSH